MINYKYLKKDEQELINRFKDFLQNVLNFYELSLTKFNEQSYEDNDILDEAFFQDKKNNETCRDILDDCIWAIQKNEPRANHLRLIIAIINSLNDIKRISNYTVTIFKYYFKSNQNLEEKNLDFIKKLGTLTIKTSKMLFELIDKFDLDSMKKNANKIFDQYIEKYKKLFYDSIEATISPKNNVKLIANSVVVFKNFDRTINHLMNIIENLISIY